MKNLPAGLFAPRPPQPDDRVPKSSAPRSRCNRYTFCHRRPKSRRRLRVARIVACRHRFEGADWGIYAAGNRSSGALKKLVVAGCMRSRLNHEGLPDQCLVMPLVGNLKRGAGISSSASSGSPDSVSVSSASTSVCAQNIRSGTMLPMPGWKPASRLWSR